MHVKSLIAASVAAVAMSTSLAVAGPFDDCHGCAMPVQEYEARIEAWNANQAPAENEGGQDTYVPPVVEESAGPTPGSHPAHPNGGGTEVTFVGTVFEGFPAGTYTQIFAPAIPQYNFPGGVIDAVVRPDGTATVWVISLGLPGQN